MITLDAQPGRSIVIVSWATTALFVGTTALTALDPGSRQVVALSVDLALFTAGLAVFAMALVAGAQRSRTHELGIGGWFFLMGSTPRPVQRNLLGALATQFVVGLAGAGRDVNSALIFGTLVPVLGLGLCGLWGARHGTFGRRPSLDDEQASGLAPRSSAQPVRVGQNRNHG
jgi:hypothetical protein